MSRSYTSSPFSACMTFSGTALLYFTSEFIKKMCPQELPFPVTVSDIFTRGAEDIPSKIQYMSEHVVSITVEHVQI
jgi:hypothetical protein